MIIILCAKSAAGKDTLAKDICEKLKYNMCISSTSRPIRENEKNGIDYNFITKEQFINKINNDEILEYRTYNTLLNGVPDIWYYGTEISSIKDNSVLVLDVDGLIDVKNKIKNLDIISIYLECSDEIRKKRSTGRGSFCEQEWNRRLLDDEKKFDKKIINENVDFIINSEGTSQDVFENFLNLNIV
jgi:guanylate kinase